MDEKIVEAVKVAMYAADRGGASEDDVARAAIEAHTGALAEAGYVMVPMQPGDDRVERGVSALLDFDRRFEAEKSAVRRIYEAMNGIAN